MLTRAEVSAAITRLTQMDRHTAGAHACEYARALLCNKAQTLTGTHQAQEWMLALALYFSAATDEPGAGPYSRLLAVMEERLHKMHSGVSDEELFRPLVEFPPVLQRYLSALSALPRELIVKSHTELRDLLVDAA